MQKSPVETNGYGRNVAADQMLNVPTASGGMQQMRASEVAEMSKESFDQIAQVCPLSLYKSDSARALPANFLFVCLLMPSVLP